MEVEAKDFLRPNEGVKEAGRDGRPSGDLGAEVGSDVNSPKIADGCSDAHPYFSK